MKFSIVKKTETYSLLIKRNILFSIFFVFTSIVSQAQVYNFQLLRDRVFNSQNTNVASSTSMDNWISTQNSNGSWSDLKYGTLTVTESVTDNHVTRLWNLAAACSKTGNVKYNDAAYKDAIKRGLQFWYTSNTIDPNWWFNKILFPQKLGELLIFMRVFDGYIPKTTSLGIDEPEIISLFSPTAINDITFMGTGANAIDIGLHYVYRGLLTENGVLLKDTKDKLESVLVDNITGDLIYQDHGPQIMTASYGWVFCDGLINLAYLLADSPAAFDTTSVNFGTVLRFIRETQVSSTRGGSWDFSVLGRGVSRLNGMNASINYLQYLADYVDPANKIEYLDALSRLKGTNPVNYQVREFNKHYWASDYTQHARKDYLFTVRNTSTRTVEAETGNGENLKANYFSYGATFISVDGTEYTNIMPVWDWSMIPGATFPYTTTFPSRTAWGTNYASTSFVGGVSDGVHGASVLNLNKSGIVAKKSWFFFNDEIVCLGAGIIDNSNRNVRTTINQSWMNAASYSCAVGSTNETMQSVSSSTYNNTNLKYIRNGKIGYYFPNQGNVKYTMKSQSGTWNSINSLMGSSTTESGFVFSLWLDHGNNPANASYSYIVVPGIDSPQKAQSYDAAAIEIIQNTTAIQAVYHKTLDILQVIFHQAGTVTVGDKSVTVDSPCALMFKNGNLVTVADPFQTRSSLSVTVNVSGTTYTKVATLPTSTEMKGSSVTVDFQDVLAIHTPEENHFKYFFYPNPTKGILHLKSENNESLIYQVIGFDGKVVAKGKFVGSTSVDLSSFSNGIYYVTITNNSWISTQKIIKY
jgi:chondroitin AC lyase